MGLIWQNYYPQPNLTSQQPTYQSYLKNAKPTNFTIHKNLDYLKAIHFPIEKNLSQGDNQLVAVVDLPVISHPDFSQKLLFDTTIQQALQTKSQDVVLPNAKPNPHGNLVTGLINGDQTGIATRALVMPIAINTIGYQDADTSTFAKATKLLLEKHVPIINHANTWGTEILFYGKNVSTHQDYDPYQILSFLDSSDSILVMAAGNQHIDYSLLIQHLAKQHPDYGSLSDDPKRLKKIIYVGIFDTNTNKIANQSNYPGDNLALQQRFISVPNLPLTSTDTQHSYQSDLSGTSFASAIVSGSIAWLMSQDNTLTANQAADILLNTAQNPCQTSTLYCQPKFYGRGMLNLNRALQVVERR